MACTGRVKFWLPEKGWGKLEITSELPPDVTEADNTAGIFVHFKNIVMNDDKTLASLEEGQEVSFSVTKGEKGWQANEVKGLDGNPVRTRLHRNQLNGIFRGIVSRWNPEKQFGWISMDLSPQSLGMQRVPKSALALNDGRIYFRWRDCGPPNSNKEPYVQAGKPVAFQLYWDEKGLGALHVCDAISLRPLSLPGSADNYSKLSSISDISGGTEQLEALSKEMEKCSVCLVVMRAQAGCIIGPKGETVKGLKTSSGVDRIYVESGISDYRLVELKGTPTSVAAAALQIMEHLAKEQAAPLEIRLVVPDDGFGRVVGKQKAQLTSIEEKCKGASVQINAKIPVSSGFVQAIAVSGAAEVVPEAVKLLIARVVCCCTSSPMPRGRMEWPGQMPPFPQMSGMGPMMMLQQMATMQMSMGKGPGAGGPKGSGGGFKGGFGDKGGSFGKGGKPSQMMQPARPPATGLTQIGTAITL